MVRKIDHIGMAVRSLDEARQFYEDVLGLRLERIEEVPSQQVRIAFYRVGDIHIELLEPTAPSSAVARFLEKNGEGVHHVAYVVDDPGAGLDRARRHGCRLVHETPVTGAGGKRIGFLHPAGCHGVLTELCSPPDGVAG